MASIKNLVLIKRRLPALVYKMFEKYYHRTLPAMVRQSADVQIRNTNFNIASKAAKILYSGLLPAVPFPKDRQMQNKFAAAIARWLQLQSIEDIHPQDKIPYIYNFQFNPHIAIGNTFSVEPIITKRGNNCLEISIPSFIPENCISAPLNTISAEYRMTIAGCALKNGAPTGTYRHSFMLTLNNAELPAKVISLPVKQVPGTLIVVAAAITYNLFIEGKVIKCTEPLFMPCTIIKAMYC